MSKKNCAGPRKPKRALLTLAAAGALPWTVTASQANLPATAQTGEQKGFYCNVKALNAAERASHTELSKKLSEKRQNIVEIEKGYQFQFRSEDVSIAALAEWAMLESKCCPFFDFHIDLENEGRLACLRLTGREGVKAFIRSEFHVASSTGKS
jgi:hypothetical protein